LHTYYPGVIPGDLNVSSYHKDLSFTLISMAKEKLVFTDEDEKLARSISEMTKQDFQEIKSYMIDPELRETFLDNIKSTAELKQSVAQEVLENLQIVRPA